MSYINYFLLFVTLFALTSATLMAPGKVSIYSKNSEANSFITRSMDSVETNQVINDLALNYDKVIYVHSNEKIYLNSDNLSDKLHHEITMKYIYPLPSSTLSNDLLNKESILSNEEAIKQLGSNKKNLHINFEENTLNLLNKLNYDDSKSSILYVFVENSDINTDMNNFSSLKSSFTRVLQSNKASSDLIDGIYYKPSGAEYSIYYANTYLYITPDLFTGIMTGLFFGVVLLIGINCLGSIQGLNNFYDKLPSVGKEA